MELENQICRLEFAKRLKELGVPQHSVFKWGRRKIADVYQLDFGFIGPWDTADKLAHIAAFTVAELGEMLPPYFCSVNASSTSQFSCRKWSHGIIEADVPTQYAETEADARSKMLIYLLENKLISL